VEYHEEEKSQEGLGLWSLLITVLASTDSQGEQSREAEKGIDHLLGVAENVRRRSWSPSDWVRKRRKTAGRHGLSEELRQLSEREIPWREKPKGVCGVK
jgi:hypothetical protein